MWNRKTGRPYYNAIVWQDTRTDRIASALDKDGRGDVIRHKAGLPPATYFSGGKLQWILENVDGVRADAGAVTRAVRHARHLGAVEPHRRCAGRVHITDVTNASRTMLMNLETLDWDESCCRSSGIPRAMLPDIRPSSLPGALRHDATDGPTGGQVPVTASLGDQQAAMVGQVPWRPVRRRTPTAPATSCCSTPARRSCAPTTGC